MQRLDNGPLSRLLAPGSELWLDGAHNPAGAEAIAQTLAELEERAPKPVGLIVGMMGKKDAAGFLAHFRGLVRRVVTVPNPGSPEATHEPAALAKVAVSVGLAADAAPRRRGRARPPAEGRRPPAAHPDLRLPLSRRPRAGAAGGRAGADELGNGSTPIVNLALRLVPRVEPRQCSVRGRPSTSSGRGGGARVPSGPAQSHGNAATRSRPREVPRWGPEACIISPHNPR